MSTIQRYGNEARQKLLDGIIQVHDAVAPTLGASGRNAVFNRWSGKPLLTNDGTSIANEIVPRDLGELQGADLAKEVLAEVNEEAGDATTTTAVLYTEISKRGTALLSNPSKIVNAPKLKRQISAATEKVIDEIHAQTISMSSLEELEKISITSVENVEYGKTIAKAIYDAGDDGIVYVNESDEIGVTVEKSDGYQLNQGLVSPYLLTDLSKVESLLENPAIILTDILVSFNEDFINIIKQITTVTKDILLICDEYHPDVLKFANKNLVAKNFKLMIVKKPMQSEYFEDIAALVGATAMTNQKGILKYSNSYIGHAKKIVIKELTTTIFDGSGIEQTAAAIENIKIQIDETKDENAKIKLQERLARFTGGIYIINVGDNTPSEQRYLKDKVDDAVNATKKAKDGYVVGGGVLLYNISNKFLSEGTSFDDGELIVYTACQKPIRQIIENAGEDIEEILSNIKDRNNQYAGYDALGLEVVDNMIDAGITDNVKSTIASFSIASKNAGLLLTTETLITPIPENPFDGLKAQ